jgi:hypothetical protein
VKLGVLVGATHLDQSNYLANRKQRAVNKYDLTLFIRLFQGSSRALEGHAIFRPPAVFGRMLDSTHEPHPRFPVQSHTHTHNCWSCTIVTHLFKYTQVFKNCTLGSRPSNLL